MKFLIKNLKYSAMQISKNWKGLILMALILSQKPGKECKLVYLISLYFSFYQYYIMNVFVSDLYILL